MALGAGAALTGLAPHMASMAQGAMSAQAAQAITCHEGIQDILNAALIAEQLATTFYYTGLTRPAVLRDDRVAGTSANPNAVASNGNPANVAYLQAALDQEQKHASLLASAGAVSPYTHFYFPATTFDQLGFTSHAGTYLWVLDHLETAFIGAYMAAVKRFALLERPDLALVALRILGVECQHRALYRVISGDDPADNVTLEVAEFDCVADAVTVLTPFLTGHGLRGGATAPIALPTAAQTASVIGSNRSV
jgi:hypothetical protein